MSLAERFTPSHALVLTLCWVAALAVTGSTEVLLFLAPALLIAIPLFAGRYIGEELIAKLVERRSRPRRRREAGRLAVRPGRVVATEAPRGSALIAFSLAKRPPPLRLLPQN